MADDTDDETMDQTELPTDPSQPTTSTGTRVPQDTCAEINTVVRLPQTIPKALQKQKGNSKCTIK